MAKGKGVVLHIRVSQETADKIAAIAQADDRPISAYLRRLIEANLPATPRNIGKGK